jgi:hypothetical protein
MQSYINTILAFMLKKKGNEVTFILKPAQTGGNHDKKDNVVPEHIPLLF